MSLSSGKSDEMCSWFGLLLGIIFASLISALFLILLAHSIENGGAEVPWRHYPENISNETEPAFQLRDHCRPRTMQIITTDEKIIISIKGDWDPQATNIKKDNMTIVLKKVWVCANYFEKHE